MLFFMDMPNKPRTAGDQGETAHDFCGDTAIAKTGCNRPCGIDGDMLAINIVNGRR